MMRLIRISAALLAFCFTGLALANGTVVHLSGTLSVKRGDGSTRILSQKSGVIAGDTLETQKDSYAQIKFDDGAMITLKPNTQFVVTAYSFNQAQPEKDNAGFSLIRGGLRAITGLISKRGNEDAYQMKTATATIGIRGTIFDVDDCRGGACRTEGEDAAHEAGVYVGVRDGEVLVGNAAGRLSLAAGQFGFIAAESIMPKLLPGDPGIGVIPESSVIQAVSSSGKSKNVCD